MSSFVLGDAAGGLRPLSIIYSPVRLRAAAKLRHAPRARGSMLWKAIVSWWCVLVICICGLLVGYVRGVGRVVLCIGIILCVCMCLDEGGGIGIGGGVLVLVYVLLFYIYLLLFYIYY